MSAETGQGSRTPSSRRAAPSSGSSVWYYQLRVTLLGIYHAALSTALAFLVFKLWPEIVQSESGEMAWNKTVDFGTRSYTLGDDARLILLVLFIGALGSYVHSATSFVSYVGNRRLVFSWAWWYLLRPFIGMALALIFYFVIRGGLLATSAQPSELSPFGIGAVAGLVGMFSKQAADKLRELFDNLFRTESGQGDDARADKLGASLSVGREMIDRRKIVSYTIPEGQTEQDVRLVDLYALLGGIVTRIPVFDHTNAVKYVIHQSLLYKFLADQSMSAADENREFVATSLTLQNLLETPGMRELVQHSLCFVPIGATLTEAKDNMEKTENCQDVFVTEHGNPDEPVQGWLTNVELLRYSKM